VCVPEIDDQHHPAKHDRRGLAAVLCCIFFLQAFIHTFRHVHSSYGCLCRIAVGCHAQLPTAFFCFVHLHVRFV